MRSIRDRSINVVKFMLSGLAGSFIARVSGLEGDNLIDFEHQVSKQEVQSPLTVSAIMVSELISS